MTDKELLKSQNAMIGAADWLADQQLQEFQNAMAGAADWLVQEQSKQDVVDFRNAERLLSEGNKKTDMLIAAVKNPPKQPMVLQ